MTKSRAYGLRLSAGGALLVSSFVLFNFLGRLHGTLPLKPGPDLFLNSLPILDWTGLLTWGWLAFHVIAFSFFLKDEARRLPYFLATLGLFMVIRNIFIVLTPVGAPEGMIPLYTQESLASIRDVLFFDNELFFSGHTGAPFLYFLLSRRPARWFYLAFSFLMAAGVLFTRNHYAIDVLGAYFITYAIYRLSLFLFHDFDEEVVHADGAPA